MKFAGNLVLIILVSIAISSAVVFAVQAFDLGNSSEDDQIAMLQEKIKTLENTIKTLNQDKMDIKDEELKNYFEDTESSLKLDSKNFDIQKLEERIKSLESKKNMPKENVKLDDALNSDAFKNAVKKLFEEFFEEMKKK